MPGESAEPMAKRILILDDEEQILYMLKRHFSSYSFEVDAVRHEGMARKLVEDKAYSVAILDLGLARLDRTLGLDMIGFIRRRNPETGIIVYTGNENPVVEKLALQLGADSFVRKPVMLSDLDKIVFKLCERELALVTKKK
jgi:two-component system alkaline phosphatase synthesis response regulator PhoP